MKKIHILFILIFFLGKTIFLAGTAAATSSASAGTKPDQAVHPGQQLADREKELVGDLLRLNLQLEKNQSEINQLGEKLLEKEELTLKTTAELSQTQNLLAKESRRLVDLLNFTYRYKDIGFLSVFLDLNSFSELFEQGYYITALIGERTRTLQTVRGLVADEKAQLARLQKLRGDIQEEQVRLALANAKIKKFILERQHFLDDLRAQSERLADRVLKIEDQWRKVVHSLFSAMQQISSLPVEQLSPKSLSFTEGQIKAEVDASAVNRLLAAAAGDNLKDMLLSIQPGGVTIKGTTGDGISFSLTGNFKPSAQGKEVSFYPRALEINGTLVEKDILTYLSGEKGISWSLGEGFSSLRILAIKTERDKITFSLALNL